MNPKDFRKDKLPIWKENKWEYFISFSMIGVGIFFHYSVLFTDWPESKTNGEIPWGWTEFQFVNLFFIFYLMGLYGLWRIHAGYNFIELSSDLPIENKKTTVDKAFERMNKEAPKMMDESMTFYYQGFLWDTFNVTILLDSNKFYINAQSAKDWNGGMIDFGTSYRLMKRIRRNIKAVLRTTN